MSTGNKTIVDLFSEIGADKIMYQNLNADMKKYQYKSRTKDGEITFITDPKNVDMNKKGFVIWVNSDDVDAALQSIKDQAND